MTPDERAALVEKLGITVWDETGAMLPPFIFEIAIDIIRAEVLEEAARVAETTEWWLHELKDGDERGPIAAAIRALKGDNNER
jgi:hypothetical protein